MLKVAIQGDDYHVLALLTQVGNLVLSHALPSLVNENTQRNTTFCFYPIQMDIYAA